MSDGRRTTALDQQIVAERRRGLRALLAEPLLTATGSPAEMVLVRRHADWLREWLARNCGWTLQIDVEVARLRKTPGDLTDGTRAARDPTSGAAFSRRRYVLLCLALAVLERADRQTTLGNVAKEILGAAASEPAFETASLSFDFDTRDMRRDLVHVVRWLLERRVLVRVHGTEEHFISGGGDVLYNVNRPVLACVLAVRRGPSTISAGTFEDRLAAMVEEAPAESEDARNRRARFALMRRLLDDPVLYYAELSATEREYLTSQRPHLLRQVEEATGLVGEVRAEGIAAVDPEGELTDEAMPMEGTEGHLTLLLAEFLAGHARRSPGQAVPMTAVVQHVSRLQRQHAVHWRRAATQAGAEVTMAHDAVRRLEALRLVRRTPDAVTPLPAIGRYRAIAPTVGVARERREPKQGSLL
ncbi:MAG TPA: TIGR02678 family protein [Polyangia bacterium]|jgi:uncharacterized protein (TIGR02678 family)